MSFCPKCGNAIKPEAAFCTQCGEKIGNNKKKRTNRRTLLFAALGIVCAGVVTAGALLTSKNHKEGVKNATGVPAAQTEPANERQAMFLMTRKYLNGKLQSEYTYDAAGHLTEETVYHDVGKNYSLLKYDTSGVLLEKKNIRENYDDEIFFYDGDGNVVEHRSGDWSTEKYQYDSEKLIYIDRSYRDGSSESIHYEYDTDGNTIKAKRSFIRKDGTVDGCYNVQDFTYVAGGQLQKVTLYQVYEDRSILLAITQYGYDNDGRVTDCFWYDSDGMPHGSCENGKIDGSEYHVQYDKQGRMVKLSMDEYAGPIEFYEWAYSDAGALVYYKDNYEDQSYNSYEFENDSHGLSFPYPFADGFLRGIVADGPMGDCILPFPSYQNIRPTVFKGVDGLHAYDTEYEYEFNNDGLLTLAREKKTETITQYKGPVESVMHSRNTYQYSYGADKKLSCATETIEQWKEDDTKSISRTVENWNCVHDEYGNLIEEILFNPEAGFPYLEGPYQYEYEERTIEIGK